MKKKILFLDLDGTLLTTDKQISPGNRAALEEALAQGHRVVINTGRPLASAILQNEKLGLTKPGCYLIAFNGGMIYDPYCREIIHSQSLPMDVAQAVLRLCDSRGVHVQTYDWEHVLVEPKWEDEMLRVYCGRIHMDYHVVSDFSKDLVEAPAKVLAISFTDRASLESLQADIQKNYPQVEASFSCKQYLEIVPRGVHKGNALRMLCDKLGMDVADSVAAGDEENDLAMLRAAGVGCAMANGVPAAKEAADYVTRNTNDQDGVAEIVHKFLLCDR